MNLKNQKRTIKKTAGNGITKSFILLLLIGFFSSSSFFIFFGCLLFIVCFLFFFPFFCFWPAAPKKVNLSLIINIKNNDNNYWQNRYIIKGNSSSLISRRCNQNLRHCLVIFDFKLLAKFKKLLHMEFRATLNYLKNNSP